jgi:transcription termination factor NusB
MYGMEKKAAEKFAFDLEKEIKEKPSRGKEILDKVEKRIHEIKKMLREGANEKEFDRLGILLHGYAALQKVLRKVAK